LGNATIHNFLGSGQQLPNFRWGAVRAAVTVRMARQCLAGFKPNTGTAPAPTKGTAKVVHALQDAGFPR
jgi:hypothetical protein